jgi:hypothetical protein
MCRAWVRIPGGNGQYLCGAGGSGLCTVLAHSGQHMDELLELGKELGAEAVVLAGTDTARLAAGDRNGGRHTHFNTVASRSGAFLTPGSGMNILDHISKSLETIFLG